MVKINITEQKKWYESKTIWINILTIIGAIATGIVEMLSAGEAITLMAIANILLRFITKSKIN